jgi:hypothetical protein
MDATNVPCISQIKQISKWKEKERVYHNMKRKREIKTNEIK